jgi:hypothetical protein
MNLSHEETANQYAEVFGSEDGKTVHIITNSISQLYQEWRLFLYFFAGRPERVEVLNRSSGSTARVLQNVLWDNALLKVRRMTDPEKAQSNRNLSIQQLVRIAKERCGVDLKSDYDVTFNQIKACRKYTDKHIVHRDLEHAHGNAETSITRKQTTEAIRSIGGFVKKFHSSTRDIEYLLMPTSHGQNEEQFLMRLHLGNQRDEFLKNERNERAASGEAFRSSEYNWPDWIFDHDSRRPGFDFD